MTIRQEVTMLSDEKLLEKVDKLRDLNISQHVPLPQLVVVGDQSSGKSSLLESLTGIPFPKGQGLCTRHVTQISSRRDAHEHVEIRIIPGPRVSEEHKKHVESFSRQVKSTADFRQKYEEILNIANEKMGLRGDVLNDEGTVFSEDILKIQVNGPREDYLTIIDVPGIFRTKTEGTTKEDMSLVKDLVTRYIKDHRTIILAVLPSNVDIATQEILELAEEYDPNGERTLGILTKPDLVHERIFQDDICDLVQGRKRPLNLGYFLVRNRGAETNASDEAELDQMFRLQPWNTLPNDRVGIPALKEQLRLLLTEITQREFPKLHREFNDRKKQFQRELDDLGPSRLKERDQRSFLSRIAGAFQTRKRAALDAQYSADSMFNDENLRLITHVINITDVFRDDFVNGAHSRHFEGCGPPQSPSEEEMSTNGESESEPQKSTVNMLRELIEDSRLDDFTREEHAELGDIINTPYQTFTPRGGVRTWIKDIYLKSRGQDLGTFNPHMVTMAFAEQSIPWGEMTRMYMGRVIITLHRFIAAALYSICPDEQSHTQLWSAILDDLVHRYQMAMDQATLLVKVEQCKLPYTVNRQFTEAIQKARGYRNRELLRPKARKDTKQYAETQYMVNLDDIPQATEFKSKAEHMQEEIHDILQAYYNIALDRFIDNVFQLAVDNCLLRGDDSPLNVFSQDWVVDLEPQQLQRIAGEAEATRKRRSKLLKQISDLSRALAILKE